MKRFFEDYKNEISAFLLFALACFTVGMWQKYSPKDHYVQLCLAILLLAELIPLYIIWKKIWRQKLRNPFVLGAKRIFVGASRFLMRVFSRFSFMSPRGNLIGGRTNVRYDLSLFNKNAKRREKKRFRAPRWKDMKTAREKLGYLYYATVTDKIKKGNKVTSNDTPLEIMQRIDVNDAEREVFTLYIDTRYDERKKLDDGEILTIKEKLFS